MEGTKPVDVKRKTPKDENLYMEEKVKKIWIGRPDEEYRYIIIISSNSLPNYKSMSVFLFVCFPKPPESWID